MKQYQELLRHVQSVGTLKKNRTGIDTISTFHYSYTVDLKDGFPLLTAKKINFDNILFELLWFLSGGTDNAWLEKHDCKFWSPWADTNGSLGPVYGYQWRRWHDVHLVKPKRFIVAPPKMDNTKVAGVGINDVGMLSADSWLYSTWSAMLSRCYDRTHKDYGDYGGKGIFVHPDWWTFSRFVSDVKKLPNWLNKKTFPRRYSLDKDFYATNRYGLDTCRWSSTKEQALNRSGTKYVRAFYPDGRIGDFPSISEAANVLCLEPSSISRQANGHLREYKGYRFEIITPMDCLVRTSITDQFENIICAIKHSPNDRRLIMSAWNPSQLHMMALPPCHCFSVFNVQYDEDGEPNLNLEMLQRSCDVPVGVPFNIASYGLLLELVSHLVGIPARMFGHTLVDAHIYVNQFDGVDEYMNRQPGKLPRLTISGLTNLDELDILIRDGTTEEIRSHFVLEGYDPQPFIKIPVAV